RKIRETHLSPRYARLAHDAMAAWRRIEAEVWAELNITAGNLAFTSGVDPATNRHLDSLKAAALAAGSEILDLDRPALERKFPQLKRARRGLFETQAGFLRATACVEALQTLASRHGVEFSTGREAEAIEPSGTG